MEAGLFVLPVDRKGNFFPFNRSPSDVKPDLDPRFHCFSFRFFFSSEISSPFRETITTEHPRFVLAEAFSLFSFPKVATSFLPAEGTF